MSSFCCMGEQNACDVCVASLCCLCECLSVYLYAIIFYFAMCFCNKFTRFSLYDVCPCYILCCAVFCVVLYYVLCCIMCCAVFCGVLYSVLCCILCCAVFCVVLYSVVCCILCCAVFCGVLYSVLCCILWCAVFCVILIC